MISIHPFIHIVFADTICEMVKQCPYGIILVPALFGIEV